MKTLYNYFKLRNIAYVFVVVLLTVYGCSKEQNKNEIYVSTIGNDTADGSISKPLATIPAAVKKVRAIRKSGNKEPMTIYLRDGQHYLNTTLVLGREDGSIISDKGTSEKPGAGKLSSAHLTFSAYPGEHPVISGGIPVNEWKLVSNDLTGLPENAKGKIWVADIPEGLDKFYTLYDEKGRLNRASDSGFIPGEMGDKKTLFFPKGALKNWENLADVEIHVRPSRAWVINMLPLESVDETTGTAKTAVSATYDMGKLPNWLYKEMGGLAASVWVENILEALDEPGEWVVNSKTRKLYLWPKNPASDGSPQGVLVPSISELFCVEGEVYYDGAKDIPVQGIAFSGLTFTHADRRAWTNDEDRLGWGMQHDWDMFDKPTALLRFRGAENCQVTDCKFLNSGGSGLRFDLHAQRNKVENCEFAHLGEAGILLAGYGPGIKDVNHHNDIINNHIHHFSEITWHSPGIWAWQSGHNRIANNFIHHSGYAAVLITNRVGPDRRLNGEGGRTIRQNEIPENVKTSTKETYENWKVREKYNHSRHNVLEYNEITHSVQLLSDGNAIYVSGAGTGNIIRYNYIHDNLEHSFPSSIRCDDDQHETLIYGNILANNHGFAAGIVSKGVNNIINNFIVAPRTVPRFGYLSYEWVSVKGSNVHNNIIVSHPDGGNAHAERPRAKGKPYDGVPLLVETKMDSNMYYHPTNPNWMVEHFAKMREVGNEQASVFADPMFTDVAHGDFSFKDGSPAIKLGIEALDVSKMGLKNK